MVNKFIQKDRSMNYGILPSLGLMNKQAIKGSGRRLKRPILCPGTNELEVANDPGEK